jgi:putative 4-mercaptohistidine N1-methyltranferase
MKDEGELVFYHDIVLEEYGLSEFKDRVAFMQADAMNLRPNFTGYDLIILPALLEELSDPTLFLSQIAQRLNDYGYLIIASDYDWDINKTPRDKWPGGFKEDGEPVTSLDGIKKVLEQEFNLIAEPRDITRTVKKSSRVTENRLLQLTIWMKKDA